MPSSAKKTADIAESKCCPVWTMISIRMARCAIARDNGTALMNCGRAPTTERIFLVTYRPAQPVSQTTAIAASRRRGRSARCSTSGLSEMAIAALDAERPPVFHRDSHDFIKRGEFYFTEIFESTRRIEQDRGRLVGAEWANFRLRIVVELHGFDDRIIELLDRHVAAGGKMIGAGAGAVDGAHDDGREIAGIAEIAARGRHEAAPSLRQPFVENRQRTGDIARPDHVGKPERRLVDTSEL